MFWIVDRSRRLSSDSDTRIGIWRSDSENLATFWSISPIVAMRIDWLSAAVVTPMLAARSMRGLMMISGRCMSPWTRGSRNSLSPAISLTNWLAVFSSNAGSSDPNIMMTSRPKPPPDCDWKLTRASAIVWNLGATLRSHSTDVIGRSFLSVRKMSALVGLMSAKAASTVCVSAASISATLRVIAVVCSSVLPGTVSIFTWLKSVLIVGWNVMGSVAKAAIVAMKARTPAPSVQTR